MFKFILYLLFLGTVPVSITQTEHSKMHNVFVYGTLKNGEPNHHWLSSKTNGESKFIGKARTVEKYPLIITTQYNIPCLLYSPGVGHLVEGEIYEVDDSMLKQLDYLEDHPTYYTRELYKVSLIAENDTKNDVECWIYFIKQFKEKLLEEQTFESYSSTGDHNRPYVAERSKRKAKEYLKEN